MHRRTGTRLTIAAGVAIGLSFSIAPQWVSGSTDTTDAGSDDARPAAVQIDDQVWPIDLHETTPAPAAAPEPAETEPAETAVEAVAPAPVPPAPVAAPTPPPAPAPDAPAPAAPAPEAPAPEAPAVVIAAGTVHVDVAPAAGTTRSVSLKSADGSVVGGPVTVDGNRITFADVADGSYDLYVEELADEGGTYLTRTTLQVSGGELVVSCDAETLDCAVS